jgi:hypothetical protein
MKIRFLSAVVVGLALSVAYAQDAPTAPPAGQDLGQRGGQHGGQRGGMGGMMGGGGVAGTVTEVAADHYMIRTDAGQSYTVHFSANTRFMKQVSQPHGAGQGQQRMGQGAGGNPPQALKATDIKEGDAIVAMGETDAAAKSVGAVAVLQVDPERAKQMREMQANYGKTWLAGKVTAIDEVKVTLLGAIDNAAHSFVADENTAFRKRRDPITLADIQVGDNVRVEGAVKNGTFVATAVTVMGAQQGGMPMVPRSSQPR